MRCRGVSAAFASFSTGKGSGAARPKAAPIGGGLSNLLLGVNWTVKAPPVNSAIPLVSCSILLAIAFSSDRRAWAYQVSRFDASCKDLSVAS